MAQHTWNEFFVGQPTSPEDHLTIHDLILHMHASDSRILFLSNPTSVEWMTPVYDEIIKCNYFILFSNYDEP